MLSIGGVVGLIGQMPGGAIVDAARSERLVAGFAIATIGCAALAYAALADLSGRGGRSGAARRGKLRARPRDRRHQSRPGRAAGDRRAARAQCALRLAWQRRGGGRDGHGGYLISSRSVFLVTFCLAIPTLIALSRIRESEVDVARAHGAVARHARSQATSVVRAGAASVRS